MTQLDPPSNLIDDVSRWLASGPAEADIIEYAKAIPDDEKPLIEKIAAILLDRQAAQKTAYFSNSQCGLFLQTVPEYVQLNYIENLTQYSASSVIKNLKKKYPALVNLVFPENLSLWATDYLHSWHRALSLAIASDFLSRSLFLHSVLLLDGDGAALTVLRDEISRILLRESRYNEVGQLTAGAELEQDRLVLRKLKFLPEEYIGQMIVLNDNQKEVDFLDRLIDVINVALQFKSDDAGVLDEQRVSVALWNQLLITRESQQLDFMESSRLAETGDGERTKQVIEWLDALWTAEWIRDGTAAQKTAEYMAKMTPEQKGAFMADFRSYILFSFVIQTIFDSDLSTFIKAIEQSSTMAETQTAAETAATPEILEDTPELVKAAADSIWKVLHA